MGARVSRVVAAVAAGGMVSVALVLGGPAADAAPTRTVGAACNTTVRAAPGDQVVAPLAGLLGTVTARTTSLENALCRVRVDVIAPVASGAAGAASGLKPSTGTLGGGSLIVPTTTSAPAAAGSTPTSTRTTAPAARAAAASPATPPAMSPAAFAAAAPAFAPMFSTLPSSFLALAAPRSTSIGSPGVYDAGLLLTGAPGLRVGMPSFLGLDPASAVTSTSQLQALPVDGLGHGLGVPSVIAVLAISAAAALGVRRAVLGGRLLPGRAGGTGTDEA